MGGSDSKPTQDSSRISPRDQEIQKRIITFENFEKTHSHIKTYEDGRYGKIALYKKNTDPSKLYILKEKWCSNDLAKSQMRSTLKYIFQSENDFIENIAYLGEEEQNTFCSEFSRFFIVFSFSPWTLKRKISIWEKKRTKDGKRKKVK